MAAPIAASSAAQPTVERHVNCVVWTGERQFAGPDTPAPSGTAFVVGIGVGALETTSVLPADEFAFPPLEPGDSTTIDVLIYVGAAAIHKQVLEVSTRSRRV